jgi:hypothetical protein
VRLSSSVAAQWANGRRLGVGGEAAAPALRGSIRLIGLAFDARCRLHGALRRWPVNVIQLPNAGRDLCNDDRNRSPLGYVLRFDLADTSPRRSRSIVWRFGNAMVLVGLVLPLHVGQSRMRPEDLGLQAQGESALHGDAPSVGTVAANAVFSGRGASAGTQSALRDTCTVNVSGPTQMVLEDGRTVSLDAESIGWHDGSLIVVGSHTHLFPRHATRDSLPVLEGSTIGVARDARGRLRPVPNPLAGRHVVYPRVASDRTGGWHILFVTTTTAAMAHPGSLDTATVWYGRFDGRRWNRVERISSVADASLATDLSSELVASDGLLSFAFSFGQSNRSTEPAHQGLVLLQRRGGRWIADTLPTWDAPAYVRVAGGPKKRTLSIGVVQGYFEDGRAHASSLFFAQYDTVWHSLRRVAGDGRRPVTAPIIRVLGQTLVASWVTETMGRADSTALESLALVDGEPVSEPRVIARGAGAEDFEAISLDQQRILWLHRDGESRTQTKLLLGNAGRVRELGTIAAPLDNPRPRAIATSSSSVFVVTSKLGTTPAEQFATTYLTQLRLGCSGRE